MSVGFWRVINQITWSTTSGPDSICIAHEAGNIKGLIGRGLESSIELYDSLRPSFERDLDYSLADERRHRAFNAEIRVEHISSERVPTVVQSMSR